MRRGGLGREMVEGEIALLELRAVMGHDSGLRRPLEVDGERRRTSSRDERDGSRGKARGAKDPYQSSPETMRSAGPPDARIASPIAPRLASSRPPGAQCDSRSR